METTERFDADDMRGMFDRPSAEDWMLNPDMLKLYALLMNIGYSCCLAEASKRDKKGAAAS
jgi:hypothetical protein